MLPKEQKWGDSMQEIIEPIIHKAAVTELKLMLKTTGLSIGDSAQLHLEDDTRIAVYAHIHKRRFLIRRRVLARFGYLGAHATPLLAPALRRGDHMRVRVVDLTPEHLAPNGKAEMYISVWGTARHFLARPAPPLMPLTPNEQSLASGLSRG